MLEFLQSFRGQACSTFAVHYGPGREVQEFIAVPRKDILMQSQPATAVALETVVPTIMLEILSADRVERHRDLKASRVSSALWPENCDLPRRPAQPWRARSRMSICA